MPDLSTASRSALRSTCSPPTRNQVSKHENGSTPAGRRSRADSRCWSRASTAATAPWPTSPPTTSTGAQVIGHCAPSTGIAPFTALAAKVMTGEPYASARRVFWIVDNGSSHRGWTAAARLSEAFPNAVMIHTPVHASWLNQIEIYFSVVQRKLLTPDHAANLNVLAEQLSAFEARYNQAAQPFDWRFNRDDLDRLLDRIAA